MREGRSPDLQTHLALPDGKGPWPGVVVLHELFGLNADIRAHADRLAQHGYLALAPDLYSWGPRMRCLRATMRSLMDREGRAFEDIERARASLASRDDCTGRIGVIGFCMGGGFAILCAPRFEFAASAPNYGAVPRDAESILEGACPIVGSYGERDRMLRGHADRLRGALEKLGVPHDVKEYPNAGHSFLNRHGFPFSAIGRVMGTGYQGEAAEDAWRRILSFFEMHLKGAPH